MEKEKLIEELVDLIEELAIEVQPAEDGLTSYSGRRAAVKHRIREIIALLVTKTP